MVIFKNLKKALLIGGIMIPTLLFGKIAKTKEPKKLEQKLFSPPWIGVEYNNGKKNYDATLPDYFTGYTSLRLLKDVPDYISLSRNLSLSIMDKSEEKEVKDLFMGIKKGDVKSYNDFVQRSKALSKGQQLVLGSVLGDWIGKYHYDFEGSLDKNGYLDSQEEFFNRVQGSFMSLEQDPFVVCKQAHIYREKYLKDIEFSKDTSTVVGNIRDLDLNESVLHAYNLTKFKGNLAILDWGGILLTGTKNTENVLGIYQKRTKIVNFEYLFFDDDKFRYRFIPKEGRHYSDFIEYDETTKLFKKNILEYDIDSEPYIKATINEGDYVKSAEFNAFGFFFKGGKVVGDESSPLKEMKLHQYGFKKTIILPWWVSFLEGTVAGIEWSFTKGTIYQDSEKEEKLSGEIFKFILATNRSEGFNFGGEISRHFSKIISDDNYNFGVSYKFLTKYLDMKPYVITQLSYFMTELSTLSYNYLRNELHGGVMFDFKLPKKTIFSLDPYYSERMGEDESGISIGLKNKYIKINGKGYKVKSKYWAAPDKEGYKGEIDILLRYFDFGINYKREVIDYDGEKEEQTEINFKIGIKY